MFSSTLNQPRGPGAHAALRLVPVLAVVMIMVAGLAQAAPGLSGVPGGRRGALRTLLQTNPPSVAQMDGRPSECMEKWEKDEIECMIEGYKLSCTMNDTDDDTDDDGGYNSDSGGVGMGDGSDDMDSDDGNDDSGDNGNDDDNDSNGQDNDNDNDSNGNDNDSDNDSDGNDSDVDNENDNDSNGEENDSNGNDSNGDDNDSDGRDSNGDDNDSDNGESEDGGGDRRRKLLSTDDMRGMWMECKVEDEDLLGHTVDLDLTIKCPTEGGQIMCSNSTLLSLPAAIYDEVMDVLDSWNAYQEI